MSRKWARMVEKNRKQINKLRSKRGQNPIVGEKKIVGRSWLFPLALASVGIVFGIAMPQEVAQDPLYIITIILYVLLAMFHFFLRKPYLKIGKTGLFWRTFTGEKFIPANHVASIQLGERQSLIMLRDGKTTRTFSRLVHLYPMAELNEELAKFASTHRIQLIGAANEIAKGE